MALYESNLPACSTCQVYFIDIDLDRGGGTGKIMRLPNGEPMLRTPGSPLPCAKCPKEGPDKAHIYELSDKNSRTYELFLASSGQLPELVVKDAVLRQNFSIVRRIVEGHKEYKLAETILSVPRV